MPDVNIQPLVRALENIQTQMQQQSTQIDGVGVEVGRVRGDLHLTSDELKALRAEFQEFRSQTERVANVQRSETKVGNLRDQLDREFGHYSVVRRTSVGMLQAFDVGNVSNATVTSVSEELMIQTPRYWLAPALVAIAAWSRDNQEMAERSVREAFSRDKNKTSLFFALILRRQARKDSSVRWLRHYVSSLDPQALTREFAIILEATSYDAFGPSGAQILSEVIGKWTRELRNRPEIVEAQVQSWVREIGIQRQEVNAAEFQALAHLSPEWPKLSRQLEAASALPQVIDKYGTIRGHDAVMPSILEDLLDDILDQLVVEYDDEELPLKREVVFHESVIEENGNLDKARERSDMIQKALDDTSDAVSMQTNAALHPETLGVGVQTQRIAIGVGQNDFRSAVSRFCTSYRSSAVDAVTLDFSSSHSNFATTYSFPGCVIGTSTPEAEGSSTIQRVWNETFDRHIALISFKDKWYIKPGLIGAAIAIVVFLISSIAGIVALIAAGGIVWFMGEQQKKKCDAAVKEAEVVRQSAIENSTALYRDALAQLVDARLIYEEADGHEGDLLNLIDTWPTATPVLEGVAS